MWLQAVAIALPRVQVHYTVPTSAIGYLSAATFLGMMLGAVSYLPISESRPKLTITQLFWGTCQLHHFCRGAVLTVFLGSV